MANPGFVTTLRICIALTSLFLSCACSNNNEPVLYEGDETTFSAPAGHKTEARDSAAPAPLVEHMVK